MKPIQTPLKGYVLRKLKKLAKLPADEAKPYDTAMTWAFVAAVS